MSCSPIIRRTVAMVALVASSLLLVGCFSFESGGMIHYEHGIRAGTTTIKRHASRDLAYLTKNKPTKHARGAAAAPILRTAAKDIGMPSFFKDRWAAATAPDQYEDIGEDIPLLWGHSKCLAMRAKLGWGTFGYSWFTYQFGEAGCDWGKDPIPSIP